MGRTTTPPLPWVGRELAALGERIRLARLRRRIPAAVLANRAGMSRATLRSLEQGDPGVSIAGLANVLNSLGLVADLGLVAKDDDLGRRLQDANLTTPRRAPRGKGSPKTPTKKAR